MLIRSTCYVLYRKLLHLRAYNEIGVKFDAYYNVDKSLKKKKKLTKYTFKRKNY